MKKQIQLAALALVLSTLNSQLSTAFGQGALTPPGAPAPTMRSLDQIYDRTDARTALTNSEAVTISQPGSYYLTTNITVRSGDAITIATNGVTLDLNGFTISSTGTGLYAQNANTCTGYRLGGTAIQATIASGCYAASGTNIITFKYNMP